MRQRRHSRLADDTHGIDLAPMLDFVLNLLIFFIVTAVFVKQAGIMVNRPTAAVTDSVASSSLSLSVLDNGEIWLDGRLVDLRAVRANIERMHAVDPRKGVLVVAEGEAQAGLIVEVVDQIHLGGVYDVTFATSN